MNVLTRKSTRLILIMLCCAALPVDFALAKSQNQQAQSGQSPSQVAVDNWGDEFDGNTLDTERWERFTFAGGSGGKADLKDGQLRMRGTVGTRAGVRSKRTWRTNRFFVEGVLAKVGTALPEPGQRNLPIGNAVLTILFDGSGANRLEWLLTSEGTFEAWSVINGRSERLDNGKLGTREKNPRLGIARRGDEVFFMLNREVGLQKTIKSLPPSFTVMLYGYGSSENNWDSLYVQTAK